MKYEYITMISTIEHFNDPFFIVDKCLKLVNKAILICTPYVEKIDDPRLYGKYEHRYLFNEKTFEKYNCMVIKIPDPLSGYKQKYIVYRIEPER